MKQLFIIGSLLISLNSLAQFSLGPALYFGKSELKDDYATIRNSTYFTEARNSFVAGVFVEYQFNNWYSMQLDVLYDQINSEKFYLQNKYNPNSYRTNQSNKLTYLSLPLSMQFKYKKFQLNIGYQTSFLLTNSYESTVIDQAQNKTETKGNGKNIFTNLNVSLLVGISYEIFKNIHIEGRYTEGLTSLANNAAGYYSDERTNQFLVGLYYKISFKKKESKETNTEIQDK